MLNSKTVSVLGLCPVNNHHRPTLEYGILVLGMGRRPQGSTMTTRFDLYPFIHVKVIVGKNILLGGS